MNKLDQLREKYDYVVAMKSLIDRQKLDKQDEIHLRIIAILRLNEANVISDLLHHKIIEKFVFDQETNTGYYCIRVIRRKEGKKYADC